jgi:hypothetical protein
MPKSRKRKLKKRKAIKKPRYEVTYVGGPDNESLSLTITAEDLSKAISAAFDYSAKFGARKFEEEMHARCVSDTVADPPVALVHPEFEGLPITPVEFGVMRRTAN